MFTRPVSCMTATFSPFRVVRRSTRGWCGLGPFTRARHPMAGRFPNPPPDLVAVMRGVPHFAQTDRPPPIEYFPPLAPGE